MDRDGLPCRPADTRGTPTTTAFCGGSGGQSFTDVPGAPHALVGILYDCFGETNDVDTYPGWTIYYKFLRAIVPFYAPLLADGTLGATVRGTQYGDAGTGFQSSGVLMAPPGYVVTGINVRADSEQENGGTFAKAFQLSFGNWTAQGVSSSAVTLSPWQGGDGQMPNGALMPTGLNNVNAVPNAPSTTSTGSEADFGAGAGGCFIGIAGRAGGMIDAFGGVWAVPQISA